MYDRTVKCKPNGAIEVTVVTEYQQPDEIRRWRDHLKAELERAQRVTVQLEEELKELDAVCALLDSQSKG